MTGLVYFIFLISGISGLVYQVVWVREFGQIFGNTIQSAALVSGTFILGLGVGSFFAGDLIDRRNSVDPKAGLAYYAYAELLICALGLALALLTPHLEAFSALISGYARGENGWYELTATSYLLRYLIAALLVGPITILMGATLTFLARFVLSRSVEQAGWKIGALYGMNTLGAAIGCAMVDLWAVLALGLMHTKMIAVALNLVAGLSALYLLKLVPVAKPSQKSASANASGAVRAEPPRRTFPLRNAALAIAISGFCAMGMEIVWFRFLSSVYSLSRYVFSLLLVTILTGMWAGSFLGGYLSRRFSNPRNLYIYSQLLFAISLLACLTLFLASDRKLIIDLFRDTFFGPQAQSQDRVAFMLYENAVILWPSFLTLFLPALFMGFAFPVINDLVQNDTAHVGSSAGHIYLGNALGAILGSLITGFVLLPMLGMQMSVTVLALGAVIAIVPIVLYAKQPGETSPLPRLSLATKVLAGVFVVTIGFWMLRPGDYVVRNSVLTDMAGLTWLKTSEGINEVAIVTEGQQGEGERRLTWRQLFTNGHSMAGTDYLSLRYMSAFVHIPLLQMDKPESVLVICFGVGNTLHAASLYPTVSSIEVADLSKNVLGLAPYFRQWNKDALADPRTKVIVNDGRQHLRMQAEGSYDLVTLEPPPLGHAGVASLYSEEFYALVHRTLKKGGYLTQWLPMYQVTEDHNRRLIKAFMNVFPNAVLLNGANKEFILIGQKDAPNQIDWRAFARRLDANEKVKGELRDVDLADPVEWLGMFAASPGWLARVLSDAKPMTDDDPVIETNRFLRYKFLPRKVFNASRLVDWCPTCFADGKLAADLRPLAYYLGVLQEIYFNPAFLKDGPFAPRRPTYKVIFSKHDYSSVIPDAQHLLRYPTEDQFKDILRKYHYFQTAFGPEWAFEYAP